MKIYALIFRKVFKFLTSSLLATVVDYLLFVLLQALLVGRMAPTMAVGPLMIDPALMLSVVGARVCSALFNYTMNRKMVFKSDAPGTLWKYAALVLCIMAGDYVLIRLLLRLGLPTLLCKVIADVGLFICSYRVQDRVIFKK